MKTVDIKQAAIDLDELMNEFVAGATIAIAVNGVSVALMRVYDEATTSSSSAS